MRAVGWSFSQGVTVDEPGAASPVASAGDVGSAPWVGKIPLEKETATHSSILSWEIPWAEEPGGLQSMGSQRVGHDRATNNVSASQF